MAVNLVVKTINENWAMNVMRGIISGRINEVLYWYNPKIGTPRKEFDNVEVFFKDELILRAVLCESSILSNSLNSAENPIIAYDNDVYEAYLRYNALEAIGLSENNTKEDFEKILDETLNRATGEIGNLILKPEGINWGFVSYINGESKHELANERRERLKNFVSDMVDLSGSYKNKNIKILTGESVKYSDFSKGNTPWIYYEV